jgi:hypothetical protein
MYARVEKTSLNKKNPSLHRRVGIPHPKAKGFLKVLSGIYGRLPGDVKVQNFYNILEYLRLVSKSKESR